VSSVQRGLRVLEHLVRADEPLTHGDLVRATGLPKSTLTDVLAELARLEYVVPNGRYFGAGRQLLAFGYDVVQRLGIQPHVPQAVHQLLERLAELTGETAAFAVEVGRNPAGAGYVLSLDHVTSPHPVRYVPGLGELRPIGQTATGFVLLAFTGRTAEVIAASTLVRLTPRTLVDIAAIDREIELVRRRGYALNVDATVEGVTAIAAPLFDAAQRLLGSISVAGPSERLRSIETTTWPVLREAIEQIKDELS
jgi:DNA-binding IclR family transcriptional regulator